MKCLSGIEWDVGGGGGRGEQKVVGVERVVGTERVIEAWGGSAAGKRS